MEVYVGVLAGLILGYVIARVVVARDPTGKTGALERGGTIVLNCVAALVVIILIVETRMDNSVFKLILRGCLIFVATTAFTTGVSGFLMYAKNEPD